MGIRTLPIMFLLVFQIKYAKAQMNVILDARNTNFTLPVTALPTNADMMRTVAISSSFISRPAAMPKTGYLPLNRYKGAEWSTFSLHYINNNSGDDWLNEHNMVVVKSIIHIANRLIVGINCHYNWSFIIAGNGAGMVLNKLPVKIYFAGVMGGAPDLGHR